MRRTRRFPLVEVKRTGNAARHVFAGCAIDVARRSLERGGELVEVEPRVFDFLVFLIEHRDRVVSTEELVDAIWEGAAVTLSSLSRAVYKARLAVGDDGEAQRIIRTVHGRGFRFVAGMSCQEPAAVDSGGTPPVGRDPELAQLEEALRRARQGRGGIVFLTGSTESATSRQAQTFASRARVHADTSAHRVRCFEGLDVVPYWPWRRLAGALASDHLVAAFEALASESTTTIRPVDSGLPGIATAAPALGLPTGRACLRPFESAMEALADEARQRSLLVVVEGLHWADLPSLAFLRFLAGFLPALPILIVATVRDAGLTGDGERSRLLVELGSDPGVGTIALAPVSKTPPGGPLDAPPPPRASASLAR